MASCSISVAAIFLFALISLFSPSKSAECMSQSFFANEVYTFCRDLPTLDSQFYWTYNRDESSLSIAFIAPVPVRISWIPWNINPTPGAWISWAINPTGSGMVGSQALIAFRDADGEMVVKTYNISSHGPLAESKVWYEVKQSSAEFSHGTMRLFATLVLPNKELTKINHAWQVGSSISGGVPDKHELSPENLNSKGTLDLLRGDSSVHDGDLTFQRNFHGVVSVITWGITVPVGIMIARYLKIFPSADPAWWYAHAFCQVFSYAFGVAGCSVGPKLATEDIAFSYHHDIGMALAILTIVQVMMYVVMPEKDHENRIYWNFFHHACGYIILVLSIFNVFIGFNILKPESKWRNAYLVLIAFLGGLAVILEAISWIIVIVQWRKKSNTLVTPHDDSFHNGHNRQEPAAS